MANRKGVDVNEESKAIARADAAIAASPKLSYDELSQLFDAAQLEIEALQVKLAAPGTVRTLVGEVLPGDTDALLRRNDELEARLSAFTFLHDREVRNDELDLDPSEDLPGGVAYDAGRKSGLLEAALICETVWAGEIGNACARTIREREEALS